MTIAILGNFRVGFTTENDLAWSFMRLGHKTVCMQEDEWTSDQILSRCEETRPDLLLYIHTHGWETYGSMTLDELWEKLKEKGITTASFHLDYWRGLAREKDVGTHPFWRTEYVFTADGGSHEWYRSQGINHFWLPPGVVERDCYYGLPKEEYLHDVIFVGSRLYHPEWQYRPQLVDWLHDTYGRRFAHYGNDGLGTIRQDDLNRLYASAKVVVGDSLCLDFKHQDYWSDRVTETMGRGGFLIHPRVKGLDKFYKDKEHFIGYDYGNFDELRNLIDLHIEDYASREQIRLNGHLHVKRNHTYTNRMQQLLDTIMEDKNVTTNTVS